VKRRFPGGQIDDVTARAVYSIEKGLLAARGHEPLVAHVLDVSTSVSWSSTDQSVALVGNTPFDKGVVRAVTPGNTSSRSTRRD